MLLAMTGNPFMELDCGPCRVRDWRAEDRPSLLRLAGNRAIWRNLTHRFPHPYTEADADFWFDLLANSPRPTHWAIDVNDQAVGGIGIDIGEGVFTKSARLGYWLGEPFWGRGLMTAAVRGICTHLFAHYDLLRLEAPVFEWNPASMRVLEKCSFVREGVLRQSICKDGQVIDAVMYARLREAARV